MIEEVFVDCHDDELEIKYKYKSIRGLTKYTSISEKFITKEITIQNLIDSHAREIIIIPIFQRDLNIDKVDNMIITYKKDKESFDFLTPDLYYSRLPFNAFMILIAHSNATRASSPRSSVSSARICSLSFSTSLNW